MRTWWERGGERESAHVCVCVRVLSGETRARVVETVSVRINQTNAPVARVLHLNGPTSVRHDPLLWNNGPTSARHDLRR